jgi:exonuclease III
MTAIWDYGYTAGDCLFDCLEFVLGIPSTHIREASMARLRTELALGYDEAITIAMEILRNPISGMNNRPHHDFSEYLTKMAISANQGGLWANIPAVIYAGKVTNTQIFIYRRQLVNGVWKIRCQYDGYGSKHPTARKIYLLFTGPLNGGHYTPLIHNTEATPPHARNIRASAASPTIISAMRTATNMPPIPTNATQLSNISWRLAIALAYEQRQRHMTDAQTDSTMRLFLAPHGAMNAYVNVPDTMHQARNFVTACQCNLTRIYRDMPTLTRAELGVGPNHPPEPRQHLHPIDLVEDDAIQTDQLVPDQATKRQCIAADAPHVCQPLPRAENQTAEQRLSIGTTSTKNRRNRPKTKAAAPKKVKGQGSKGKQHKFFHRVNPKGPIPMPMQLPSKDGYPPMKKCKIDQTRIITSFCEEKSQASPKSNTPSLQKSFDNNDQKPNHLKAITANVPGLWTHKADIASLIHTQQPHILTLVDVRLHKDQRNSQWLRGLLRGYKYWVSTAQEEGKGVRGVLVAVKEYLTVLGKVESGDTDTDGRIKSITLTLPHSAPLVITGVYGPACTSPVDEISRSRMYSSLTQLGMSRVRIDMGDWNATLFDEDRNSRLSYPKDHTHRTYVSDNKMSPLDNTPRPHTYRHGNAKEGSITTSRIDDFLTNRKLKAEVTILAGGHLSDHSPLLACIDTLPAKIFIPNERKPAPQKPKVALVTPIATKDKMAFADAINSEGQGQSQQIHLLNRELDRIIEVYVNPFHASLAEEDSKASNRLTTLMDGRPASEVVNELAEKYDQITKASRTIAMKTCQTKTMQPGGSHHRTRAEKAERNKLKQSLKMTRALQTEAKTLGIEDPDLIKAMIETTTLPLSRDDRDRWAHTMSPPPLGPPPPGRLFLNN